MQIIQGQIIAKSGTSNINKDLGNHLHFELYYNGKIAKAQDFDIHSDSYSTYKICDSM